MGRCGFCDKDMGWFGSYICDECNKKIQPKKLGDRIIVKNYRSVKNGIYEGVIGVIAGEFKKDISSFFGDRAIATFYKIKTDDGIEFNVRDCCALKIT